MLLFISGAEIVFVFFIVLLVFGADKIPSIARTLAKGMTQVRQATNEIKSEIQKTVDVDIENPTPVLDQDPLTEMPNASKVTAKGPHVLDVQKSAGSKSVKKTKARSITKVTQKKDKLSSSLSVSDSQKKKAYLFNVKSETLYPKFRMYIFIMFIMQIVIGSIVAIFSIFAFLNSEFVYGVVELVLSVLVIFSAYVTREICEIFVDSADSILEKNSREV